jgi:uncharacterized protein (DUF427 family)
MTSNISISKAAGTWVVRAGGAVLGESDAVLELTEGSYAPVLYFPRGDLAMAFLEASTHETTCPHKGKASYYSIVTKSTTLENVAWSYEDPIEAVKEIDGYIAFYPSDKVTVEQL